MRRSEYTAVKGFFILIASIALLVLSGCGQRADSPAYDTAGNPDNYPQAALSLIEDIESDRLTGEGAIGERFADLYTLHTELLDNQKWKTVIVSLGKRFFHRAELLRSRGPASYTSAGEYYNLAAFALPSDDEALYYRDLFTPWLRLSGDSALAGMIESIEGDNTASDRVSLLREFWFGDSLSHRFAAEFLLGPLFKESDGGAPLTSGELEALASHNRAFAALVDLAKPPSAAPLASFEEEIDLIAARVNARGENTYRLECYFLTHENISTDYSVAVRVSSANSNSPRGAEELSFVPFDFEPSESMTKWRVGKVAAAFLDFEFYKPITGVSIGLFDPASEPVRFATPVGEGGRFVILAENVVFKR